MMRDIAPFGLRIPHELKALIKKSAKQKRISMNSEILSRLNASFYDRVDLNGISTGDLVRELIDRNVPGRLSIEIVGLAEDVVEG